MTPVAASEKPSLAERVRSNLDDALENGYDVSGWEIDDIVVDLLCFAADVEDEDAEAIKPHVIAWVEWGLK